MEVCLYVSQPTVWHGHPSTFVCTSDSSKKHTCLLNTKSNDLRMIYITIINADKDAPSLMLIHVGSYASKLDLEIGADKCYSFSLEEQKCDKQQIVSLQSGITKPISSEGTKFLLYNIADTILSPPALWLAPFYTKTSWPL